MFTININTLWIIILCNVKLSKAECKYVHNKHLQYLFGGHSMHDKMSKTYILWIINLCNRCKMIESRMQIRTRIYLQYLFGGPCMAKCLKSTSIFYGSLFDAIIESRVQRMYKFKCLSAELHPIYKVHGTLSLPKLASCFSPSCDPFG